MAREWDCRVTTANPLPARLGSLPSRRADAGEGCSGWFVVFVFWLLELKKRYSDCFFSTQPESLSLREARTLGEGGAKRRVRG